MLQSLCTPVRSGSFESHTNEVKQSRSFCVISPNLSSYTPTFPILHHPSAPSHCSFLPLEWTRGSACVADMELLVCCLELLYANRTTGQLAAASRENWALHAFPWDRGIVFGFLSSQRSPHLNQFQLLWQAFKIRSEKEQKKRCWKIAELK